MPGANLRRRSATSIGYAVVVPDARDAEAVRRRPDARQRHEAGGELPEVQAAACCCRASPSAPARPTTTRSRRCSLRASRARPGSCSATSCTPRALKSLPSEAALSGSLTGRPPESGGLVICVFSRAAISGKVRRVIHMGGDISEVRVGVRFIGGVSAAAVLSGSTSGVRAEEVRRRCDRHRDQARPHQSLQRPGFGLRRDRQGHRRPTGRCVNDAGGINGRKVNFITYDDGYQPPKTVEMVRQLVEQDKVFALLQHARHADQHGDPEVPEPEEGAAALRRHRRVEVGQSQGVPVDDGLPARLPHRGRDLRQAHPGQRQGRQDRRA